MPEENIVQKIISQTKSQAATAAPSGAGGFVSTQRLGRMLSQLPDSQESKRQLVRRLVERGFEVEGINRNFSPVDAVKNLPGSLVEFGKDIFNMVSSPVQTAQAAKSLVTGAVVSLFPDSLLGEGEVAEHFRAEKSKAGAVIDYFSDRYGSLQRLGETIERDPAGFLSDASVFLSGGASLTTKAGTALKLSKITETANQVRRAANALDPLKVVTKIPVETIKATNKALGASFLRRKASEIAIKGYDLPLANGSIKRLERSFGKRIEDVLTDFGVAGAPDEIVAQANNLSSDTKRFVDNALSKIPDTFKSPGVEKLLDKTITSLKNVSSQKLVSQRKSLEALKGKKALTLSEINEARRAFDEILSSKVFTKGGDPKLSVIAQDLKAGSAEVRKFLYKKSAEKGLPNLFELNRQTQFGNLVSDIFQPAYRREVKRMRSLLDTQGVVELLFYVPRRIGQSIKFRTTMAARLANLSGAEKLAVQGAIETGRHTVKTNGILKRIVGEMRPFFPEMRVAQDVSERINAVSRMPKKERKDARVENVLEALANIMQDDASKKRGMKNAALKIDRLQENGLSAPRSILNIQEQESINGSGNETGIEIP